MSLHAFLTSRYGRGLTSRAQIEAHQRDTMQRFRRNVLPRAAFYRDIDRDVIDPDTGAFCPVIHDFTRESLPVLNYRLDDVLVPDPRPCPCGSACLRIARIEGREDDMLWCPPAQDTPPDSGTGARMVSSEAIRTTLACLPQPLRDYRVIRQGGRLHLWLDGGGPDTPPLLRAAFDALGQRLGCALPELVLHDGLPPETCAKRRRIRVLDRDRTSKPSGAPTGA